MLPLFRGERPASSAIQEIELHAMVLVGCIIKKDNLSSKKIQAVGYKNVLLKTMANP